MNEKTDNKKMIAIVVGIVIALLAVIAGVIIFSNSPAQRLKKQLSLGERYLSELKYDEAVLAFEEALKIEPRTEAAYIGLANAYIGKEDYESALAAVERGIEAVGETEAFMALKEDIEEQLRPQESEAEQTEDTGEGSAAAKPEVVDWSFDEVSDIWQFSLFGKNVSDWTVDDFGQYLIDNGYVNYFYPESGAWGYSSHGNERMPNAGYMPQNFASLEGFDQISWSWNIFDDGESKSWHLTKRGTPSDAQDISLDPNITIPELSSITEKDFIQRLPKELQLAEGGNSLSVGDGQLVRGENKEENLSVYNINFDDNSRKYTISFDKDTGEIFGIDLYEKY